jgi:hypothetical protein
MPTLNKFEVKICSAPRGVSTLGNLKSFQGIVIFVKFPTNIPPGLIFFYSGAFWVPIRLLNSVGRRDPSRPPD